ncbi:MAG: TetR/AcrR family transcriptional regulator [Proteobacteria bacterium]|nr:TetR/AcrR family transcriptional regulator [Pseudomonadota bacterium]
MKEKRKTRSELKREAIVDAAKRAFEAFGVQGTSMDKLAEMARVSKRTVYNHFASKEELVVHLLTELWARTMVRVEVPYRADLSLEDQLETLVRAEVELVSGPDFLGLSRAAIGYYLFQPEKIADRTAVLQNEDTALHHWLKAAVDDGRLRPMDADFAVRQLHNLVKGSCYWPQLIGLEPEPDETKKQVLIDETVALFLSRYRA